MLKLSQNQLFSIQEVENLKNLTYLDLNSNQIDSILPIENLSKLTKLYLNINQILQFKAYLNSQN